MAGWAVGFIVVFIQFSLAAYGFSSITDIDSTFEAVKLCGTNLVFMGWMLAVLLSCLASQILRLVMVKRVKSDENMSEKFPSSIRGGMQMREMGAERSGLMAPSEPAPAARRHQSPARGGGIQPPPMSELGRQDRLNSARDFLADQRTARQTGASGRSVTPQRGPAPAPATTAQGDDVNDRMKRLQRAKNFISAARSYDPAPGAAPAQTTSLISQSSDPRAAQQSRSATPPRASARALGRKSSISSTTSSVRNATPPRAVRVAAVPATTSGGASTSATIRMQRARSLLQTSQRRRAEDGVGGAHE